MELNSYLSVQARLMDPSDVLTGQEFGISHDLVSLRPNVFFYYDCFREMHGILTKLVFRIGLFFQGSSAIAKITRAGLLQICAAMRDPSIRCATHQHGELYNTPSIPETTQIVPNLTGQELWEPSYPVRP
jgi:hypothetical protein